MHRTLIILAGLTILLSRVNARADTLYVSNIGNDTIEQFTLGGVGSLFAAANISGPNGLVTDGAGNLYVACGDYIEKVASNGVSAVFAGPTAITSGLYEMQALAFGSSGQLYVANAAAAQIVNFTADGSASVFVNTWPDLPFGLVFDGAGNLYASNLLHNTIGKISPAGVVSVFANTGLNQPYGLAFDSAGNLYVANSGDNTIERFTPSGVGSIFASTGLNRPIGLAFDSFGNLYVANNGNDTIERFASDGVGSVFASTGLNRPTFITIAPETVPEPTTILLFGGGVFILVSFRYRSRRINTGI